jgi:hypothetical protein
VTDPNDPPARPANRPLPGRLKAAGIVSAAAGAFLLVLMGTVSWRMAPQLLAAPEPAADGSRFAASRGAALTVFCLFGSVLLFGAVTMVVGVRQARTGTRSRPLLYLQWATGALILIMAFLAVTALKASRG